MNGDLSNKLMSDAFSPDFEAIGIARNRRSNVFGEASNAERIVIIDAMRANLKDKLQSLDKITAALREEIQTEAAPPISKVLESVHGRLAGHRDAK